MNNNPPTSQNQPPIIPRIVPQNQGAKPTLNIYLDIFGVLTQNASPQADVMEFITYILQNFSQSTYWLTTFCRQGQNLCSEHLRRSFPSELVDQIDAIIQPTDWLRSKTEALDFTQPFIWFDDNLTDFDRQALRFYNAERNFFWMNPQDQTMAKKALEHLKAVQANLG